MVVDGRRWSQVRLALLWGAGRAVPRLHAGAGDGRSADAVLATLFDLECEDALRCVLSFC